MTLEISNAIYELNLLCLDLIGKQSETGSECDADVVPVAEILHSLGPRARSRVASSPYLLMHTGFPVVWCNSGAADVSAAPSRSILLTAPDSIAVSRKLLAFAWHVVQSKVDDAPLLLGVSMLRARVIAACSLSSMLDLADHGHGWVRPRWCNKPEFWRQMSDAAISSGPVIGVQIHLRGLQMMAAEIIASSEIGTH